MMQSETVYKDGKATGKTCVECGEEIRFDPRTKPEDEFWHPHEEVAEMYDPESGDHYYPIHFSCGEERGLQLA